MRSARGKTHRQEALCRGPGGCGGHLRLPTLVSMMDQQLQLLFWWDSRNPAATGQFPLPFTLQLPVRFHCNYQCNSHCNSQHSFLCNSQCDFHSDSHCNSQCYSHCDSLCNPWCNSQSDSHCVSHCKPQRDLTAGPTGPSPSTGFISASAGPVAAASPER